MSEQEQLHNYEQSVEQQQWEDEIAAFEHSKECRRVSNFYLQNMHIGDSGTYHSGPYGVFTCDLTKTERFAESTEEIRAELEKRGIKYRNINSQSS